MYSESKGWTAFTFQQNGKETWYDHNGILVEGKNVSINLFLTYKLTFISWMLVWFKCLKDTC